MEAITSIDVNFYGNDADLIAKAAGIRGISVQAFIAEYSLAAAREFLRDQITLIIPPDKMDVFLSELDAPAKDFAPLKCLLDSPSPWDCASDEPVMPAPMNFAWLAGA